MIRKLFSLTLRLWSGLILLIVGLIVVIDNFWREIILLFFILHLLQRHSDKLFQLLYFVIDFEISQIFLIRCCFNFLNFLLDSCQLLLFDLFQFLLLLFFCFLLIWIAHSALFLFGLMCIVFAFDFLHLLHQLVLRGWCLF